MNVKHIVAAIAWLAVVGLFTVCAVGAYTLIMVGEAVLRSFT